MPERRLQSIAAQREAFAPPRLSEHGVNLLQPIHSEALRVGSMASGGLLLSASSESVCLAVADYVRRLPPGGVLLVDFADVQFASPATLREIIRAARGREERYALFRLEMRNHDLFDSLELAATQMDCLIPAANTSGSWHILGKSSPADRLTLDLVTRLGEMTASTLKRELSISLNAASNRLKRLADRGAIRRQERPIASHGGREYVYRPIVGPAVPWPERTAD